MSEKLTRISHIFYREGKRIFFFKCLWILSCVAIYASEAMAQSSDAFRAVVAAVRAGDSARLTVLQNSGISVDTPNSQGSTPLCMMIRLNDVAGYRLLVSHGADTEAPCVSKIAPQTMSSFCSKAGPQTEVCSASAGKTGVRSASSKSYWTEGAVAVAGVGLIAAVAASGGGGGGSSDDGGNSQEDCVAGQYWTGSSCATCASGATSNAASTVCVCSSGEWDSETNTCPATQENCVAGQYWTGSSCVACGAGSSSSAGSAVCVCDNTETVWDSVSNSCQGSASSGCIGGIFVNGVCECEDGYELKNGACVKPADGTSFQDKDVKNTGTISLNDQTSVGLTAEIGASAENSGLIEGTSDAGLTGILVNGLGENGASVGTNTATGKITLAEQSSSGSGVIGMSALSGAVVENKGEINITSRSENASYAMKADAAGGEIKNEGKITLTAADQTKNLYGIYALDRVVKNDTTGEIITTIDAGSSNIGTVSAVYGKTVQNNGSIVLNETLSDSGLGFNGLSVTQGGTGENAGTITLAVDHLSSVNGLFGAVGNTTLSNTGTISLSGTVSDFVGTSFNTISAMSAQGISKLTNEGKITADLALENGGAGVSLMSGFAGKILNSKDISLTLNALPDGKSVSMTVLSLQQNENNASDTGIENANGGTIVVDVTDTATVAEESFLYVMGSSGNATISNAGQIKVSSVANNLSLAALSTLNSSTLTNEKTGVIQMTTSGQNVSLEAFKGTGNALGRNEGQIILTHTGSGNVVGAGGSNESTGSVVINADNMSGSSNVLIGVASSGSAVSSSDINSGSVTMNLTGTTSGVTRGVYATGGASNSGSVTIVQNGATDFGTIEGVSTSNDFSLTGTGRIDITVNGSGVVRGISSTGDSLTTSQGSSVNITVQNTGNASVVGLQNYLSITELAGAVPDPTNPDSFIVDALPEKKTITNNGTISIDIRNTNYSDAENIVVSTAKGTSLVLPFQVAGIVTNSYAVNNGRITIDATDSNAKVAGMIAYDGGIVVNAAGGVIEFSGVEDNFTALYGTGYRDFTIPNLSGSTYDVGNPEKRVRQYSTVYNAGVIRINSAEYQESSDPDKIYGGSSGGQIAPGADATGADELDYVYVRDGSGGISNWNDSQSSFVSSGGTFIDPDTAPSTWISGSPLSPSPCITDPNGTSCATFEKTATASVLINDGVRYVSEKGGVFDASGRVLSGDVTAGVSLVLSDKNENVYVGNGQGEGALIGNGDMSSLTVSSNSVMFAASLVQNEANMNGADILLERINFSDLLSDTDLGGVLDENYNDGNAVSLFNRWKQSTSLMSLDEQVASDLGYNLIPNFAQENFGLLRHLGKTLTDELFAQSPDQSVITGYDIMYQHRRTKGVLTGYDDYANSLWTLGSVYEKNDARISLGVSVSQLHSDYDNDSLRNDVFVQVYAPLLIRKNGFEAVAMPRLGYDYSHYRRKTPEQTFEGDMKNWIYGLSNEVRRPFDLGFLTIEPAVELNLLGYYQQKVKENRAEGRLVLGETNNFSVEAGLGLYAVKRISFGEHSSAGVRFGGTYYHEFADPYHDIKTRVAGLDGAYVMRGDKINGYENKRDRGLVSAKLDYIWKNISLYGQFIQFIENDTRLNVNMGLKIGF